MTKYPLINPTGYHQPGDMLLFTANQGFEREIEKSKLSFSIGQKYTVRQCLVDEFKIYVSFEEVTGHWNAALFEKVQK